MPTSTSRDLRQAWAVQQTPDSLDLQAPLPGRRAGARFNPALPAGVRLLGAVLAVAAVPALMGGGAVADGAVAVGTTGDVIRHGIAFGMVIDEPKEKAAEIALARCRAFVKGSSRQATAECKVTATFSRQCFAVAYDPNPGTPGAGWGVGKDQIDANLAAMKMCEATAGPGRARFCQVESGACDTKN
jgi:hypothetical protein